MDLALDPLEIHTGTVWGARHGPQKAPLPEIPGTPAEVLEALLVEALSQPPCHVLFSGGLDSSLILAAAVRAARKHGLADPIPLTSVYQDLPETREDEWQASVLRHVGLGEGRRIESGDAVDALGPIATEMLAKHGPYWPPFSHSMTRYARIVQSGAMVTGGGGDEVFSPWRWRRVPPRELVRLRPARRIAKWGAYYSLPLRVRRFLTNRGRARLSWLRPAAEQEWNVAMARSELHASSWMQDLEAYLDSRYLECLRTTLQAFSADEGVSLVEPFYDPRFIRAMGSTAPPDGYAHRSQALAVLFAGYLPTELLRRQSKAVFGSAFWGPAARAFAQAWDLTGVDTSLVDPERLKQEWLKPRPDARSISALQLAWVARQRG